MKKAVALLSVIILAILFILVIPNEKAKDQPLLPQPQTIVVDKALYGEQHELKEQWYEQMHMTAPGVDWRAMDNESRAVLRASRSALRRTKTEKSESIADGLLTGQWIEKGANNVAGRMHNIDIDFANNVMYGASDGGQIWKADLGGQNWESLSDHYHVKGVHFLRIMHLESGLTRILQINYDSLLMYSDNEGVDWEVAKGLSAMRNDRCVRAVSDHQDHIYLLFLRSNQKSFIYRSTDQGENFELVMDNRSSSRYVDIWMSRYESTPLFYLDRDELLYLDQSGEWISKGTVSTNFSASEIQACQMNGSYAEDQVHLGIMYRVGSNSRFVTSPDGGDTWKVKGSVPEGPFMNNSFGMSSTDPNKMGMGGVNAYRSFDGGDTWELINAWGEYYGDVANKLHADIPEIEYLRKPDGTEWVYVSTDGGSYLSEDHLQSVKNISLKTLRNAQYYSTYTHRENTQVIYAGAQDQGFQRTTQVTDGAADFEQTISGDYGHIVSGDGGRSLWTVYPGFAMYYPDAAGSNYLSTWDFSSSNHLWLPPLMADPYFPQIAYLAGGSSVEGENHLWVLEYKNSRVGVTELPYDFGGGTGSYISAMAFSPINKDYRYVLNAKGKLYYSTDRGVNWTQSRTYGPGSHYFYGNSIIPDPKDINTIYIGGSGYSGYPVWKSTDGGRLFRGISDGIPRTLVFEMAINEDGSLLFAATEVGPFVYIVSEDKWYDLAGASAPDQTYWSVDYVPALRTARFGTYGRGIWDFKIEHLGKIGTYTDEKLWVNAIGMEMYPNPTSGTAVIEYHLNQSGEVALQVLDASGRLIINEVIDEQVAGSYTHQLNLSDQPAGLYYVRVQSGNQVRVEKLIRQ